MNHLLRKPGLRALSGAILASGVLLAGCNTDKLVTVTDPTLLTPGNIENAASVPGLVQGAYVQLIGGYSGFGDDSYLSSAAAISDEMYWGDTFTTRQAADIRTLQPTALGNISDASFARLQQTRFNSRRAYAAITKYPNSMGSAAKDQAAQSKLRAFEGFTYVTISEGWCGSVPFSTVPDTGDVDPSRIVGGVGLNTKQMNDTAITRFDQALALSSTYSLAKIGKARALLNEGRYAEAAAAVSGVPDTYVFLLEHSTNAGNENNPMAALMQNGRYGVSNLEGAQNASGTAMRPDNNTAVTAASAEGLNFRTAADPRVPYEAKPNCFTSSIRCWLNDNYPTLDADVPMASGVEARLIEAEAAMQTGDTAVMLAKLNSLRSQSANLLNKLYPNRKQTFFDAGVERTLPPLTDPANPTASAAAQLAARRDMLFRERAFWLYNTGHRQGDLRRLARATTDGGYGLGTGVFPSGPYFRGGSYGADVAYPVPFNEANNATYTPGTCDTTKP